MIEDNFTVPFLNKASEDFFGIKFLNSENNMRQKVVLANLLNEKRFCLAEISQAQNKSEVKPRANSLEVSILGQSS